jgi:hypothetical protein
MKREEKPKKIVEMIRNDIVRGCQFNKGEICGFDDFVADNLIRQGFAQMHGDGKPKKVSQEIPDEIGSGYFAGPQIAEKIKALSGL